MQTIVKEKYKEDVLQFGNGLNTYGFKIYGQTVERSCEDRNVYFETSKKYGWLNAEDAIELGTKLIDHGRKAMLSNMYHHQLTHYMNRLKIGVISNKINKIILNKLSDSAPNYGSGYCIFEIKTIGDDKFSFEMVLYQGYENNDNDNDITRLQQFLNIDIEIVDNLINDRKKENIKKINQLHNILSNNKDIVKCVVDDYGISDTTYTNRRYHLYVFAITYKNEDIREFEVLLTPSNYKNKFTNLSIIKKTTV